MALKFDKRYIFGHNTHKKLDYAERIQIQELLAKGFSCGHITTKLGRAKNTIVTEVRNNGGRQGYDATLAQANVSKRWAEANKVRSEKNKAAGCGSFQYKQSIENMEMQLDILCDVVKELAEKINKIEGSA